MKGTTKKAITVALSVAVGFLGGCLGYSYLLNTNNHKSPTQVQDILKATEVDQRYLPLGTVVKTNKAGDQQVMIVGRFQIDASTIESMREEKESEDTTTSGGSFSLSQVDWEYIGVPYPQGYIGKNYTYLFNTTDITSIDYSGNSTEENSKYLDYVSKVSNGELKGITFKDFSASQEEKEDK